MSLLRNQALLAAVLFGAGTPMTSLGRAPACSKTSDPQPGNLFQHLCEEALQLLP